MSSEILDDNVYEQQLKDDQIVETKDDYDQRRRLKANSRKRSSKALTKARAAARRAAARARKARKRASSIRRRLR